jgi:hypothetical protein
MLILLDHRWADKPAPRQCMYVEQAKLVFPTFEIGKKKCNELHYTY